jgi:hypothetical protein
MESGEVVVGVVPSKINFDKIEIKRAIDKQISQPEEPRRDHVQSL